MAAKEERPLDSGEGWETVAIPPTASVCGLFCRSCSVFIGSTEDPERLHRLAGLMGLSPEQVRCEGCRSAVLFAPCASCSFRDCAQSRGVAFCGACADYPCEDLKAFQAEKPHRRDLWKDQERIAQIGPEAWEEEQAIRYRCPACGTRNSAYDLACRGCGRDPSCPYVAEHREAVAGYLASRGTPRSSGSESA